MVFSFPLCTWSSTESETSNGSNIKVSKIDIQEHHRYPLSHDLSIFESAQSYVKRQNAPRKHKSTEEQWKVSINAWNDLLASKNNVNIKTCVLLKTKVQYVPMCFLKCSVRSNYLLFSKWLFLSLFFSWWNWLQLTSCFLW